MATINSSSFPADQGASLAPLWAIDDVLRDASMIDESEKHAVVKRGNTVDLTYWYAAIDRADVEKTVRGVAVSQWVSSPEKAADAVAFMRSVHPECYVTSARRSFNTLRASDRELLGEYVRAIG